MILAVHATFGAAVASLVPSHPIQAFTLAFVSHLVLDAIPHRDYDLISLETGPDKRPKLVDIAIRKYRLIRDMLLVSSDALFGVILAFLFFFDPIHPWIFLIGAIGSMVPDFLTFLYLFFKHKPLMLFIKFHVGFMHSKIKPKISQIPGVILQFITISVLLAVIFIIKTTLFSQL